MKLLDLDAQFIGQASARSYMRLEGNVIVDGVQGVLFQCPKCAAGKPVVVDEDGSRGVAGAHYVEIWFANPRNAPVAPPEADSKPHHRWTVSGSSLDDLTLSPSVNLDVPHEDGTPQADDECRWHGSVTNGDAA